jgi:hypothetical protein
MNRRPIPRRTPLARAPMKPWIRADDDKVDPAERAHVLKRDGGCIAPQIEPDPAPGPCWGKIELDHVKDDPRIGDRAPSDRYHLVSVCNGHSEKGMRAGYQWNTAHRAEERAWLALKEPRPL